MWLETRNDLINLNNVKFIKADSEVEDTYYLYFVGDGPNSEGYGITVDHAILMNALEKIGFVDGIE